MRFVLSVCLCNIVFFNSFAADVFVVMCLENYAQTRRAPRSAQFHRAAKVAEVSTDRREKHDLPNAGKGAQTWPQCGRPRPGTAGRNRTCAGNDSWKGEQRRKREEKRKTDIHTSWPSLVRAEQLLIWHQQQLRGEPPFSPFELRGDERTSQWVSEWASETKTKHTVKQRKKERKKKLRIAIRLTVGKANLVRQPVSTVHEAGCT